MIHIRIDSAKCQQAIWVQISTTQKIPVVELSLFVYSNHVPVTACECFLLTSSLIKALASQSLYWPLTHRKLGKNREITVTLKDQNIVLYPPVKLFLDLPKPVRIHQPGDPEDGGEGETPDVSHMVKDRNKVIHRQLNYTWLPTPMGKKSQGHNFPYYTKKLLHGWIHKHAGAVFLPSHTLCPTLQGWGLFLQPKFSPASVRGGETHHTPLQDALAWGSWKRGMYPAF